MSTVQSAQFSLQFSLCNCRQFHPFSFFCFPFFIIIDARLPILNNWNCCCAERSHRTFTNFSFFGCLQKEGIFKLEPSTEAETWMQKRGCDSEFPLAHFHIAQFCSTSKTVLIQKLMLIELKNGSLLDSKWCKIFSQLASSTIIQVSPSVCFLLYSSTWKLIKTEYFALYFALYSTVRAHNSARYGSIDFAVVDWLRLVACRHYSTLLYICCNQSTTDRPITVD